MKCTPVFNIQYDGQHNSDIEEPYVVINNERRDVNRFSLLPQSDWFSETEHSEWYHKMICLIASNGDVRLQNEFYDDEDFLVVFKQYTLTSAYEQGQKGL
jgi:hypothetical protein